MNNTKFWTIRGMEPGTISAIKQKAKYWNCTVPEILKTEFVNRPGLMLYNFDEEVKAKIEKEAKDKGMSISSYIKYLYNRDEKKETINKIKEFLAEM